MTSAVDQCGNFCRARERRLAFKDPSVKKKSGLLNFRAVRKLMMLSFRGPFFLNVAMS